VNSFAKVVGHNRIMIMQVTADTSRSSTAQNSVHGIIPPCMGRVRKYSIHARVSLLHISPCKLLCCWFVTKLSS